MTKNSDLDNRSYYRYGIEIDTRGTFSLSSGSGFGKNVIRYWVDNSSSLNADNRKKDISILGKSPTDELNDTTLTPETEHSISFSEQQNKFCLNLNYNGSSSSLLIE